MGILHIRILWIFQIKILFENFIFVEIFEVKVWNFEVWPGEKTLVATYPK